MRKNLQKVYYEEQKLSPKHVLVDKCNFKQLLFFGKNLKINRDLSKMHLEKMFQKRTKTLVNKKWC